MNVPAAAVGKDLEARDIGRNQDAADTRSAEEVARSQPMEWNGKRPNEVAELGVDKLAEMSFHEIEKQMGLEVGDRTDESSPTGNAPAHEIDRQVEDGTAQVLTEDMIAAAAVAALQKPEDSAAAANAAAAAATAAAASAAASSAAATEARGEEAPAQVLESRDGKKTIPYSVLENARKKIAQLSEQNAQLLGKKAQEEQLAAVKGALTEEQIATMRESLPEALVESLIALNNFSIEVKREKALATPSQLSDEQQAAQTVNDLIDEDPVLAGWRDADDKTDWNRAVTFDEMLFKDPVWGKKPIAERLGEVRRLMGSPVQATTEETPAQKAAAIAAAAEAAALKATKGTAFTHSDMPGGHAPAQNESQSLEAMDIMTLAGKVDQMSPAQFEKFMAGVGG